MTETETYDVVVRAESAQLSIINVYVNFSVQSEKRDLEPVVVHRSSSKWAARRCRARASG